jgi:predicted transcriptional regulator
MKVKDLVKKAGLDVLVEGDMDKEIGRAYVSDLLSDVMANTEAGGIWITIQTHTNIIAIATLNELAAIIISSGKEPADEAFKRAQEEGVNILGTAETSFEVAGKLYKLGIKG